MEDFVPYELAVKLDKAGFNYDTKEVYEINVLLERYFEIPKPTISQVLKWLREEEQIEVNAAWDNRESKWFGYANEMDKPDLVGYHISSNNYDSYEQAALAEIEYVFDNLI